MKTMETSWISSSKEDQVGDLSMEGDGFYFLDSEGVLLVDNLKKGQSITGPYYANLIKQLQERIQKKRRRKLSLEVFFHQDNAQAHKSSVAPAAIHDCGFKRFIHLIWHLQTTIYFSR